MLTTIYLPAGTVRVYLRDVSGLFADALHPETPEDTPRVLSYLQKEATDSKLASQWCGMNNNFPVSLTEQDVRELNRGVWRHLPPLELLRDTGEGPQKIATLLPEPQWKQYADAFAASPPEGWRLIAVWRNPFAEQWVMNDEARKDWKRLLVQQATTGKLMPRAHVSGIPTPRMAGHQLMDAFFTVEEFTEFARGFAVEVRELDPHVRASLAAPESATQVGKTSAPLDTWPVSRFRAQESAILQRIGEMGHMAKALPRVKAGKKGVKDEIRRSLKEHALFTGEKVFDKAWERLRATQEIQDSNSPSLG